MQQLDDLSEDEFCEFLTEAITNAVQTTDDAREEADEENFEPTELRIRSFTEACLLTDNAGLVVRIGDVQYQVTVVREGRCQY